MTVLATDKMELSLQTRALQSRARFVGFIFQKRSEGVSFFYVFYVKANSRYSLVRIFELILFFMILREAELLLHVDHLPRSRREAAETETLQRRPRTAT